MSDQQVYEYVIVYHPPLADLTKARGKSVIVEVDNVMAKSVDDARLKAARNIPCEYDSDDIEIQVRPF